MKDPAFLFYDGDAARDVSHMNRLERGCYFDLIQAQRKFGGFTVEQARKILGKDFNECWEALTLILIEQDGVYFIEWVKDSTIKRKEHSKKQKERIDKYWKDKKEGENKLRNNHGITVDVPLENENENENVIVNSNYLEKGVKGEKPLNISFDTFWNLYDKKTDRVKCEIKWKRLTDSERISCIDKLPAYTLSTPDKKFRRDPETYLNNKSWENEIINVRPNTRISVAPKVSTKYLLPDE